MGGHHSKGGPGSIVLTRFPMKSYNELLKFAHNLQKNKKDDTWNMAAKHGVMLVSGGITKDPNADGLGVKMGEHSGEQTGQVLMCWELVDALNAKKEDAKTAVMAALKEVFPTWDHNAEPIDVVVVDSKKDASSRIHRGWLAFQQVFQSSIFSVGQERSYIHGNG